MRVLLFDLGHRQMSLGHAGLDLVAALPGMGGPSRIQALRGSTNAVLAARSP